MAEVKKQKIACPKCKKQMEANIWDTIEIPYDAKHREQVLQNALFKVSCDDCKISFPILYQCKYNDFERKFLLMVSPKVDFKESKEHKVIEEYNQRLQEDNRLRLAQGGYRYRIVRNENELREKVIIFEEGLDDRYIETLKLTYVPLIKNKIKDDSKILGVYFDKKKEGGYQLVVLFNNQPPMCANANMDIYKDMQSKLKDIVEEKTPEGLCMIDAKWALEVMMTQVEKPAEEKDRQE